MTRIAKELMSTAGALALSACGGGGGGGIASIPPPPVTPTTTPTPSTASLVTIFPNPTPMDYKSVGVSATIGNMADSRFAAISSADADQPHIRYSSGGYYEISLPGKAWDTLVPYKGLANPTTDNTSFQPASTDQNFAGFSTVTARWAGYQYSEYASWFSRDSGRSGWVAIGIPTPSGGVPLSGSATYLGTVHGSADVMGTDMLSAPSYYPTAVDGSVSLSFDFAGGSLSGAMELYLIGYGDPLKLGSFAFKDTVFSPGSTTYSGRFDSAAGGQNFFLGQFTGPNAQETIGAWALPFVFTTGNSEIHADNQTHQAIGAWVAKH